MQDKRGWVNLTSDYSYAIGYCRRSWIDLLGWFRDMPSQFWSCTKWMAPLLWYPQRYNLHGNLETLHSTDFTCNQVPLAYMAVFSQAILEPGSSGLKLSAHPTCPQDKRKSGDYQIIFSFQIDEQLKNMLRCFVFNIHEWSREPPPPHTQT